MKRCLLLLEFYKKNSVAVLLLVTILAASLFYMVRLFGYVGYQTCTLDLMEKMGLEDGVYMMAADAFDTQKTLTYDDFLVQDFSAVEQVLNTSYAYTQWEDKVLNIVVCDQEFIRRFSFADRGRWLDEVDPDPESPIQVVMGGFAVAGVSVGDRVFLDVLDEGGNVTGQITAEVIGKDNEPTLIFNFGNTASTITADEIYQNVNNVVFMTEEDAVRMFGRDITNRHSNFMVLFQADASLEERQMVLDFLSQRGRYVTFEEIRAASLEALSAELRQSLPKPLFMLGVSVFAMMSVSVLLTSKQMQDYRIYYLVGYSRRHSFLNTFVAILGIGGVAGAVNLLYIFYVNHNFQNLRWKDPFRYHNYLAVNNSGWYILLFVLAAAFLSSVLPLLILRKNSAIELYRRAL